MSGLMPYNPTVSVSTSTQNTSANQQPQPVNNTNSNVAVYEPSASNATPMTTSGQQGVSGATDPNLYGEGYPQYSTTPTSGVSNAYSSGVQMNNSEVMLAQMLENQQQFMGMMMQWMQDMTNMMMSFMNGTTASGNAAPQKTDGGGSYYPDYSGDSAGMNTAAVSPQSGPPASDASVNNGGGYYQDVPQKADTTLYPDYNNGGGYGEQAPQKAVDQTPANTYPTYDSAAVGSGYGTAGYGEQPPSEYPTSYPPGYGQVQQDASYPVNQYPTNQYPVDQYPVEQSPIQSPIQAPPGKF